jgi:hypothetical protein
MTRKYTPPLKVMSEPKTRKEICDRIDELEAQRPRSGPVFQAAIDDYVKKLREKLEKMPCSETKG